VRGAAALALRAAAGVSLAACAHEPPGAWSPETATVLYTAAPEGDAELFVRPGAAGEPENLTRHTGQDHWGGWSPDGTRIVFQSLRDGNREVYVMGADGSDPVNLSRNEAEDLLPEWSPDGTRILFFSNREVPRGPNGELAGHLWVMDADGGGQRRLTREPLPSTYAATWSPDERSVLMARPVGGDTDLRLLDVDTGEERVLLVRAGADGSGRFSPDGTRIAFHAAVGEESRIAVVNADGSGLRFLTEGGLHYYPTWSPDGRWLLFSGAPLGATRNDLLVVSADGGAVTPLVAGPGDERSGSWSPVPASR